MDISIAPEDSEGFINLDEFGDTNDISIKRNNKSSMKQRLLKKKKPTSQTLNVTRTAEPAAVAAPVSQKPQSSAFHDTSFKAFMNPEKIREEPEPADIEEDEEAIDGIEQESSGFDFDNVEEMYPD